MWVIAETSELGTGMIKTVVTDEQGRYLLATLEAGPRHGSAVMESWIPQRSTRNRRPVKWL